MGCVVVALAVELGGAGELRRTGHRLHGQLLCARRPRDATRGGSNSAASMPMPLLKARVQAQAEANLQNFLVTLKET